MRALERAAFATGVSEAELQDRAGRVVAAEVQPLLLPGQRVAILVGHGNNGRDGAVAGTALAARGIGVELILAPRHAITEDEQHRLRSLGATLIPLERRAEVRAALDSARIAIDAIAGIGTTGPLREPLASLVRMLNAAHHVRVVALDVPSGIDADSGEVLGDAVWAETTVTLGAVKQGLLRFPAAERVGRLVVRDIGIPASAGASIAFSCLDLQQVADLVPRRPLGAHKYSFGRVLVVAGSDHYLGAPLLSAGGAARSGAGLVTVASTSSVRQTISARLPEVTYTQQDIQVDDDPLGSLKTLEPYVESHAVIVLGPGLGRSQAITKFVEELL